MIDIEGVKGFFFFRGLYEFKSIRFGIVNFKTTCNGVFKPNQLNLYLFFFFEKIQLHKKPDK